MNNLQEIQQQVHFEITKLQEQLLALNTIRIELEQAKKLVSDNTESISEGIQRIQLHMVSLQNLYANYAEIIKDHTIDEIKRASAALSRVADEVIHAVQSLQEEMEKQLEKNDEIIQQADKLYKLILEVDFPTRFDAINIEIHEINGGIGVLKASIEKGLQLLDQLKAETNDKLDKLSALTEEKFLSIENQIFEINEKFNHVHKSIERGLQSLEQMIIEVNENLDNLTAFTKEKFLSIENNLVELIVSGQKLQKKMEQGFQSLTQALEEVRWENATIQQQNKIIIRIGIGIGLITLASLLLSFLN